MRVALRFAVALTALAMIAACGSSGTSATATTPTPSPSPSPVHIASVDPCTLVTADEASTAVGTPVTNLAAQGGVALPSECIYGASGKSVGVIVYAQVLPDQAAADAMQPDQIVASLGGQVGGVSSARQVLGIGDKAVEYTSTTSSGAGIAIFVFRYNVVLMIIMGPSTDSNAIETMARKAVDRIG